MDHLVYRVIPFMVLNHLQSNYSKRQIKPMKHLLFFLTLLFFVSCQEDDELIIDPDPNNSLLYFPPTTGSEWAKIDVDFFRLEYN